jgi:signal transduction histidine kinase
MERWRTFGLVTLVSVVFLIGLFLVAESGRARLRVASEEMQGALARRVLIGEFRQQVAEAALTYRTFLVTGRVEDLAPLRSAGRRINDTAERLVDSFATEEPRVVRAARQLRYLAGVQTGTMMSVVTLYSSQGPAAALQLARAQGTATDPVKQFLSIADYVERYEAARVRETHGKWEQEVARVKRLSLFGTLVNIVVVILASLMALTALRRHREGMTQVARRKDELEVEAALKAEELNEVYGHLQTLQEQERSRLARGLHDELGGLLLAARMDLTWLKHHARDGDPTLVAARLDRVVDVLDQGIDLKRRVIEELRPTLLDNMGLVAAIRWQLDETCRRAGLHCHSHFPDEEPEIAPRAAIALFRVAQEALTNVLKHSNARNVQVRLDATPSHLLLCVADDGDGISSGATASASSHGLAGMRHRMSALGGTLSVGTTPRGGTEIRAIVPRLAIDRGEPGSAGTPQEHPARAVRRG